MLGGTTLDPFTLEKGVTPGWISYVVSFVVEIRATNRCIAFVVINSMELIPLPNCSLMYLHSNDMNSS